MKRLLALAVLWSFSPAQVMNCAAQAPVPLPAVYGRSMTGLELDQLLQSIALYPDPLIGQMLSSATFPSEIVLANRFVAGGGDPNLIDQQPWDNSIKALARYPTVLKWMDDNLAWTTSLGQAFLAQPQDVMDSIQRLRAKAQSLGNLKTTPQENVVSGDGDIEILPADPQVVYVPVYQPDIVYYQPWSYGDPFITFGVGFYSGAWLDMDFDWHHHRMIEWGRDHPRPGNWWTRRPSERADYGAAHGNVWHQHGSTFYGSRGGDRGREPEPQHPAPRINSLPGDQGRAPELLPHHEENFRPRAAQGAFIGLQGSHETQQFSNRGQESRQPAPPPRPAMPSRSPSPGASHSGDRKR